MTSNASSWGELVSLCPGLDTARLDRYADELHHWNKRIRLVGPRDIDGIRVQIADALLPFLLQPPLFPLLDLGSGAGLPGVPLAIAYPRARVVCMEPLPKRVSFLRHVRRTLHLPALEVAPYRSDTALAAQPDLTAAFATATARAVADIGSLLRALAPFLAPDAKAALPRGAEPPTLVAGWAAPQILEYRGPPGCGARSLHLYTREVAEQP